MEELSFKVKLSFDEPTDAVIAELEPSLDGNELDFEKVRTTIERAGYGNYYILEPGIKALLNAEQEIKAQCKHLVADYLQHKKSEQEADETNSDAIPDNNIDPTINIEEVFVDLGTDFPSFDVAKKLNGRVEVSTAKYDLEAYLRVYPPFGGEPVTADDIQECILEKEITTGLLKEVIENTIASLDDITDTPILIAKGTPPVKGKNSSFEALVSSEINTGPKEDDKGVINYKDINEFVLVQPGDKLMKRHAPKPGKNGLDVYGRAIPAPKGDVLPFSHEIEGATVSADDHDLLVASVKGHPIIYPTGVTVDPALELKNVSLATGNVDFDGSVHVKEDVADGMTIKATGEVIVNGAVGKATIVAGADVIIDQGLIGGSSEAGDDTNEKQAKIECKGSFRARFVTFSKIRSGGTIWVNEYVSHSDLDAKDNVFIGQEGGKGKLFGGTTKAFHKVTAKCLGTKGSVITKIQVGAKPDTIPKLRRVMQNIREKEKQIEDYNEKLHRIMARAKLAGITEQQKEAAEKISYAVQVLLTEIVTFRKEEKALQSQLVKSKAARITATQKIYQNVIADILHVSYKVTEDIGRGKLKFEARKIVLDRS